MDKQIIIIITVFKILPEDVTVVTKISVAKIRNIVLFIILFKLLTSSILLLNICYFF